MKHSLFSPLHKLLDQSLTPGALRLLLVSVLAWSPVHAETESSNTSSRTANTTAQQQSESLPCQTRSGVTSERQKDSGAEPDS